MRSGASVLRCRRLGAAAAGAILAERAGGGPAASLGPRRAPRGGAGSGARGAALGLVASLLSAGCLRGEGGRGVAVPAVAAAPAAAAAPGAVFLRDGKPLCFAGSNNYYLTYRDRRMVDDVFQQAKAMGLEVMRVWAFIDRGSLDDSVPSTDRNAWEPYGTKQGVYFQYWDTAVKDVRYNEGAEENNGLVRLDYVLAKAAETGVKVVLVLTNNWKELGGMDQYLKWFNLEHHHQFYTDERARQAYKNYAKHLIERFNTITKIPYRDDPSIFAWELANQPRCRNYGQYDAPEGCSAETLTAWVEEMSGHIKSLDPNHLVAVGDEGFFNRPGHPSEQYSGRDGVDHEAFLALPSIDYGTFHLYPDTWSTSIQWGEQWIIDHVEAARRAGKPTVLEEYGVVVKRDDKSGKVVSGEGRRRAAYTRWNEALLRYGASGSMFWLLAGIDPDNPDTGLYRDLDHFAVYNVAGEDGAKLLADYAGQFQTRARACEVAVAPGAAPRPFVAVARRAAAAPAAAGPAGGG